MRIIAQLLVLLPLLSAEAVRAVDCQTHYRLTHQAEVEALGATGCDSVVGDLYVVDSWITNLDGLANITSVGGTLNIEGNTDLTSIDGLANLVTVEGNLNIESNPALTNIDGLANLASVEGDLRLHGNQSLTDIDGLVSLSSVGTKLTISGHDALTNVNGLVSLRSTGTDLLVLGNTSFPNVDGLINLTVVGGDLRFNSNALTNIDGLANLASVGGNLILHGNHALTDIDGLVSLNSVGGYLDIFDNDALTDLDGLANVTSVGDYLAISKNDALTNLDGLANLITVESDMAIADNDALINLDGLISLTSIGGELQISTNAALVNLDGLTNITSVGERLFINDNDVLTDLDGLASITSVGDGLQISHNDTLTNCEHVALLLGWPNGPPDDTVGGSISIYGNAAGATGRADTCIGVRPNSASYQSGRDLTQQYLARFHALNDYRHAISDYRAQSLASAPVDSSEAPASALIDNVPVSRILTAPQGVTSQVEIDINITHDRPEHLYITLTTPQGNELILWDRAGAGTEDIEGTFPTTLTPVDTLSGIAGQTMEGDWMLYVEDVVAGPLVKEGVLNSWGIRLAEELVEEGSSSPIEVAGSTRGRDYTCTVVPVSKLGKTPVSDPYTVRIILPSS